MEDIFDRIGGVNSTKVGYIGGNLPDPTYEEVCSDRTGHAEAVEIDYDPDKVSYSDLLDVFWNNHNPTTLNRQGPDVGTQYRSAIFYCSEEQCDQAQTSKRRLEESGTHRDPVVTTIQPASTFYKAEGYHQKYFKKHGI